MIPAALIGQLQRGLADFLRASFASTTPGFEGSIERLLAESGAVTKGPYVQVMLPFRKGSRPDFFPDVPLSFTPHLHQERTFERLGGEIKRNTLVATGTGSGKTECFLYPVLAHCLARAGQPGIKAILIYPMNALASDQALRLARTIHQSDALRRAVTAGLYVGEGPGERREATTSMGPEHIITDHATLQAEPPDIMLTNYKMLDYLLVRPRDRHLWEGTTAGSLRFLVVDELHTFDGAQGTDLACLIRRLRDRLRVEPGALCCVGTSATLGGEAAGQRLREYAAQVFGEPFNEESVIAESRLGLDEFRGGATLCYWSVPPPAEAAALEPARYTDRQAFLEGVARRWFDPPPAGAPGEDAWAVQIGEHLLRHVALDSVLRLLGGRPATVDELVDGLGSAFPALVEDREYGRAAVLSFLALVSAARRWRDELPVVRAQRAADGRPRPSEPFLQVRLQAWQREMRRMVASFEPVPRLRFSDDLTPAQAALHLPAVHCRECGAMGWATLVPRDRPWDLRVGLQSFYRAFFAKDGRVWFLFPTAADQDARLQAERWRIDPGSLARLSEGKDPGEGEVLEVAAVHQVRSDAQQRVRLHRDCPFCGYPESLTLLGFQAATLTGVFIDQLFASPFNDDKKLLTFSDSVQDAAHRAGFFGARSWRFNLRVALQRVVDEVGEGLPLPELPARFGAWWRGPGGLDLPTWIATFIAPNMEWFSAWEALKRGETVDVDARLVKDIERRVAWEVFTEYGMQARVGRSLPRTLCSTASVDAALLDQVCAALLEPLRARVAGLEKLDAETLRLLVAGLLHHAQERGAILHAELPSQYVESENTFIFQRWYHLPDYGPGSRLPALVTDRTGARRFDALCGPASRPSWYERWADACQARVAVLHGEPSDALTLVMPALVRAGILEERAQPKGGRVWGLKPEALRLTARVRRLRCERCGHETAVPGGMATAWDGAPCLSARCPGAMALVPAGEPDYFARLYRGGDIARIFAAEHTGLLKRGERETLEAEFKEQKDRKPWFPNLLSSTPTLEMGIDIGDLSSAILCSVPPAQANYLQRVGRAGRRDGNSLILTVANARNHDLYFYGQPEEMLAGEVAPPGVYLDASAVLERQLAAFCFDRWAASGVEDDALPRPMRDVYRGLEGGDEGRFPHNWRCYVMAHERELVDDFCVLFGDRISPATRQHLLAHMARGEDGDSRLVWNVLDALHAEKHTRDELKARIRRLSDLIREKRGALVKDDLYAQALSDLEREKSAFQALLRSLDDRDALNFFTDEGLLPNYAFPEAPVRLRSVIWRKREGGKKGEPAYETTVYTYERPAAVAISELAPDNEFYAGGRRVVVDQVDVSSVQPAKWRFCDACSHAELMRQGEPVRPTCPSCQSPMWPDPGQEHDVLQLRSVFANTNDRKSRLSDDREEREPRFYSRQTLATFADDERGDAWKLENEEFPFAFEYHRSATFREVNFGRSTADGTPSTIGGRREVRQGFVICRHCGKVQDNPDEPKHTLTCASRKKTDPGNFTECVYLYREFHSEAVRMLLPIPGFNTDQDLHSFTAAVQVGLRDFFQGRVDHLRTMVCSEPVPDTPARKQFLVLFDTVPGGTGYLKELLRDPANLRQVLELALRRLTRCTCASDPERDGCYRCIYLYRGSHDMAHTSRNSAVAMLTRILDRWEPLKRVPSLSSVSVSGLMDSLLEARFVEALRQAGTEALPSTVTKAIVFGKPGYRWNIGGKAWNVEPQRNHGPGDGFGVNVSIDFVLHPTTVAGGDRPVAIFLDGWAYHHDRVGLDFHQRMALLASGRYDVWSFTWEDVARALDEAGSGHLGQPEPLLYRDPVRLEQKIAAPSLQVPQTLRARLDEPTWRWFVDTMAGLYDPVDAHRLAFATSLTQLDPQPDTASVRGAVTGLPPAPRADFTALDAPLVASIWPAEATRPVDITVAAERQDLFQDTRSLGSGTSTSLRIAVVLRPTSAGEGEAPVRRAWAGCLRLAAFLRPIRDVWFLAEGYQPDLSSVALMRAAAGEAGVVTPWGDVMVEVDPDLRDLTRALAAAGAPPAEVGMDLPDAAGRALDIIGELVWPEHRVAVLLAPLGVQEQASLQPGWTLFVADDLAQDPEPLLSALAAAAMEDEA